MRSGHIALPGHEIEVSIGWNFRHRLFPFFIRMTHEFEPSRLIGSAVSALALVFVWLSDRMSFYDS